LEVTDLELIKSCLAGKQEAFAVIVRRYQKLVFNVVHRLSGGRADADDLSQEVFLKAYRSLGRYNPEYRFSTWLMKIATNACIDSFHRDRAAPLQPEEFAQWRDPRPDPSAQLAVHEDLERLRGMVAELPDEYRVPVVLFHQQGLSYREIEEVLGESETLIKNRLFRARRMLLEKRIAADKGRAT
jgi:RNA polymerase sigma-70 factor (ECF subfamily)